MKKKRCLLAEAIIIYWIIDLNLKTPKIASPHPTSFFKHDNVFLFICLFG